VIVIDPSAIVFVVLPVTVHPEHTDVAVDVGDMTHEHESDETNIDRTIDPTDIVTVPAPLNSPSVNETGMAEYAVEVCG
jgi:hypothetical protein